jgi:multidrug transporter EmrE-like cation transporter
VLTGAVVHAGWNLLLAGARDSEAAGAVALGSGALIFTPVALATWDIRGGAWPYIAASAALELTYFILLGRAYHRAELSLVYPIARGSAPVLVLIASAVIGTALGGWQVLGILLVAGGIVAIRGLGRDVHRRDLALALGVGGAIAAYTLVDKQGLKHAGPLPYLWVVNGAAALVYLPLLAWGRGSRIGPTAAYLRNGRRAAVRAVAPACLAPRSSRAQRLRGSASSAPTRSPSPRSPARPRPPSRPCAKPGCLSRPRSAPRSCTSASGPPARPERWRSWPASC